MGSATAAPVDPSRLLQAIDRFSAVRVAVFGDLIVDEFIYGDIARVSREAPVLILNYDSTDIVPGGAGNAANNVAALGGSAISIGFTGRDETGRRLLEALRPRVDVRSVVRPRGFRTPTKTRILAGGIHSAKQQVVRIDRAAGPDLGDGERRAIRASLLKAAMRCDALLVSDYGGGARLSAARGRGTEITSSTRRRGSCSCRFAILAAAVSRDDDLHAKRIRGGAAARHPHPRQHARPRAGRTRAACAGRARRPC